jgi:hypothetical protein
MSGVGEQDRRQSLQTFRQQGVPERQEQRLSRCAPEAPRRWRWMCRFISTCSVDSDGSSGRRGAIPGAGRRGEGERTQWETAQAPVGSEGPQQSTETNLGARDGRIGPLGTPKRGGTQGGDAVGDAYSAQGLLSEEKGECCDGH